MMNEETENNFKIILKITGGKPKHIKKKFSCQLQINVI